MRSSRSSGSDGSKESRRIFTPTSSPVPLTVTVTRPSPTVPSTVASASSCCTDATWSCICWACWRRALKSKPPSPNGFWSWLMVCLSGSWRWWRWWRGSVVGDLFDDARTELALEELRPAERVVVRVGVVAVDVLVGDGRRSLARVAGGARVLDGAAGGRHRLRVDRASRRRLRVRGSRRLGRRVRGLLRHRRAVDLDRRLGTGLGGRGDDRLDAPVVPDHVDRGLTQDLLAAPAAEGVARPGVDEGDRQRLVVDGGDLGVLAEQDPRVAALELHRLEQVGPQPAHVDQAEPGRRTATDGRCRLRLPLIELGGITARRLGLHVPSLGLD